MMAPHLIIMVSFNLNAVVIDALVAYVMGTLSFLLMHESTGSTVIEQLADVVVRKAAEKDWEVSWKGPNAHLWSTQKRRAWMRQVAVIALKRFEWGNVTWVAPLSKGSKMSAAAGARAQ